MDGDAFLSLPPLVERLLRSVPRLSDCFFGHLPPFTLTDSAPPARSPIVPFGCSGSIWPDVQAGSDKKSDGSRGEPLHRRSRSFRQRESKRRTLAGLALGPDAPTVRCYDALRDAEPEATSTVISRPSSIATIELLEDVRDFVGRYALSRVRYAHSDLEAYISRLDANRSIAGRVAKRILH